MRERKVRSVLAGPGAAPGSLDDTVRVVIESGLPAVFDAGALTALADHEELRKGLRERHVLTPHEGEFKRLFPLGDNRLQAARDAAASSGATILLKGDDTIIARPDGVTAINSNASGWLATGGSGDTLSGLITGLLAQGASPFDAACMAAWIHAECARAIGPGLIADDLAGQIPGVLKHLFNSGTTGSKEKEWR
jgi:NAD(P)H-hydrate epimerase